VASYFLAHQSAFLASEVVVTLGLFSGLFLPLSRLREAKRGPTPTHLAVVGAALMVACALGWWTTGWSFRVASGSLWWVVDVAVGLVTWKGCTAGLDPRIPRRPQVLRRLGFVAAAVLALWSPWCLPLWLALAVGPFGLWTHHVHSALRLVAVAICWLLTSALARGLLGEAATTTLRAAGGAALLLVLLAPLLSQYFSAAMGKLRLGPRPWSWILECRFDLYTAAAYLWGFWRNRRPELVARSVSALRPFNWLLGLGTVAIELSSIGALATRWTLTAVLVACIVLHLSIWLAAGVAFWESIVLNALLVLLVWQQPADLVHLAFGLVPLLVLAVVLLASAAVFVPFDPHWLAWWCTRVSQDIFYEVLVPDGSWRTVPNSMLTPFDRGFVQQRIQLRPGLSIVGAKGECFSYDAHQALLDFDGNPETYDALLDRLGQDQRDRGELERQLDYLVARFTATNRGDRLELLPSWLAWLRAPVALYNGSGPNPRYRRGLAVLALRIRSRDECFVDQSSSFVVLTDQVLVELPIPGAPERR